ncbi:MAG: TatD DNase family protein [Chloroflexi bacterium]|nr:MAG: TatD DNase family protein [Chloroflexota bacterium]
MGEAERPIPPGLIDSHAHLHDPAFDDDRAAVLGRARAAGLSAIVTVGTDHRESERAVILADQEPDVFAVVGFHPHDAKDWNPHERAHIARLASRECVVAIGEIGLDFFRDLSPRDVQARVLRDQLSLADEVGLPVVIHSRDAHEETYGILSAWADAKRREAPVGVIHCFSGDAALARRYVALGFAISFAGPVTYPKNAALREAAAAVPADRLVVETDCPYLSPQRSLGYTDRSGRSIRGKRNEPAVVSETAAFIAELRGESVGTLVANTSAATRRLFRLPVDG